MTETVELYDLGEYEFKTLLNKLPDFYDMKKGFFEQGLTPVFRNYGESDDLFFGVHLYSQNNGTIIYIILSEYTRTTKLASVNITCMRLAGWLGHSPNRNAEIKVREILRTITYDELESYTKAGIYGSTDELFICPKCRAQYLLRVLKATEDGRVICQNCNNMFEPVEIDMTKRAASYDS